MFEQLPFDVIAPSRLTYENSSYALVVDPQTGLEWLAISEETAGFADSPQSTQVLLAPRNAETARTLARRLPWLQPVTLGLQTSAGFGDRLGLATPGHVLAVRATGIAAIFAQQSVRENSRTGRTPQQVVDDALWGAFAAGWQTTWGADADHLKTPDDIAPFVKAGYTFYTIDPGDYVDDSADTDDPSTLLAKAQALPWEDLQTSLAETRTRYVKQLDLDHTSLFFDELALFKALAKYGGAVAHTMRMTKRLYALHGTRPFEMEISVDETGTTTTLLEHFYLAAELRRLGVPFVSLAPRFVGRFEKGVDYIGDLDELGENIAGHASIMRFFGQSYKLSLHTGSDKFGVYPLAMQATNGLVHLKTAGTSYLEALRLLAMLNPPLLREIWDFSREHYEHDRQTYHVSANLAATVPATQLTDADLPELLNQFDARQILHVTFGSVLAVFGPTIQQTLRTNQEAYHVYIQRHFDKHLAAFKQS